MIDIPMLILAICMAALTVASIVGLFIQLYMDKRKTYKVTYLVHWSIVPFELSEYVHATSIVHAARKIKDVTVLSIEEVKDED